MKLVKVYESHVKYKFTTISLSSWKMSTPFDINQDDEKVSIAKEDEKIITIKDDEKVSIAKEDGLEFIKIDTQKMEIGKLYNVNYQNQKYLVKRTDDSKLVFYDVIE